MSRSPIPAAPPGDPSADEPGPPPPARPRRRRPLWSRVLHALAFWLLVLLIPAAIVLVIAWDGWKPHPGA